VDSVSTSAEPGRSIVSVDDLADADVQWMLDQARRHLDAEPSSGHGPFTLALLFQASSLRTRVGYAAAACRLGGQPIDVPELRQDPTMTTAESFSDTVRTLQGMVDLIVTRTVAPLEQMLGSRPSGALINGGEAGGEHPTQALVDLLAMEEECGPLDGLRVGLCGDLSSRAALSLVKLLGRKLPAALVLMSPPGRALPDGVMSAKLAQRTEVLDVQRLDDLDVLHMVGLPEGQGPGALFEPARRAFALGPSEMAALPPDAVVLSPMPVVDELSVEARRDPRLRLFAQSDRGVAVRMACIEWCLGESS
jgi:aspartate carbamoyltransferase catalytic subunit